MLSTLLYAILVVIDKVLAYKLALTPKLENVSTQDIKRAKRQLDLSYGISCQSIIPSSCWSSIKVHSRTDVSPSHGVCFRPKAMESHSLPMPPKYFNLGVGLH